jgi:hypothetical protein
MGAAQAQNSEHDGLVAAAPAQAAGVMEERDQSLDLVGLGKEGHGPGPGQGNLPARYVIGRNEDDLDVRIRVPEEASQLQPVDAGHDVHDGHVHGLDIDDAYGLPGRVGLEHEETLAPQTHAQASAVRGLIIDDENSHSKVYCANTIPGKNDVKRDVFRTRLNGRGPDMKDVFHF